LSNRARAFEFYFGEAAGMVDTFEERLFAFILPNFRSARRI